jgi:hypothetical protein
LSLRDGGGPLGPPRPCPFPATMTPVSAITEADDPAAAARAFARRLRTAPPMAPR